MAEGLIAPCNLQRVACNVGRETSNGQHFRGSQDAPKIVKAKTNEELRRISLPASQSSPYNRF
jgi:hypothetical protein